MEPWEPDLEGLRRFSNRADRERSPIFVGRTNETEALIVRAHDIGVGHEEGQPTQGNTTVISGCPGSGKSAFLSHLAEVCTEEKQAGVRLIPVQCALEDLTAPDSDTLKARIAKLGFDGGGEMARMGGALAEGLGQRFKMEKTFSYIAEKVRRETGRNTVVCLLVDEIQNVREENAQSLHMLHTKAFSPPIFPIYAGLDPASELLEKVCGISRGADTGEMTMGLLGDDAAAQATEKLFTKYRVDSEPGAREAWAEAIDEEALGFAQHLHVALKAACRVLVERRGLARHADVGRVKSLARSAREEYYARKVRGEINEQGEAVLDVVERATSANGSVRKRDLVRWMRDAMESHDPSGTRYTRDEAEALVDRMLRRGVLHLTAKNRAEVPIPSLHTWLTGSYADEIGWRRDDPFETEVKA